LSAPGGVALDDTGTVDIADLGNNRIRKISVAGSISTVAGSGRFGYTGNGGPATAAELSSPNDVAVDCLGNIYIADYDNNCIRKVTSKGIISTIAGTGSLTGNYSGNGGAATAAELTAPVGVAVDNMGNVYIADEGNSVVCKVTPAGIISNVAGAGIYGFTGDGGPAAAELSNPFSLAADGSGNIYISDNYNDRIRKVTPSGNISTIAGNGAGGYSGDGGPAIAAALNTPWGLTLDRNNNVYIADYLNNRVRMITFGIPPVIEVDSLCAGAKMILYDTAIGGTWNSSNPATAAIDSAGGVVTGLTAGTVIITYATSNNYGCFNFATFPVVVLSFTVNSNVVPVTCYEYNNASIATIVNGGSGAFQYTWSNAGVLSFANGLYPGMYTLTVKDSVTQCVVKDTFLITQPDSLQLGADVKNDDCKAGNGSISIFAAGGTPPYSYLWNNIPGTNPTGLSSGAYTLKVTDANDCIKTLLVNVEDTCGPIIVHDVITPNGDGINDNWIIEGIQNFPHSSVHVFDKWGSLLFEKDNYNNDWGGKNTDGGALPDGTYYYIIKLNVKSGSIGENIFKGAILIKR
jgi:gliding motility-associated-like protein